MREDLFWRENIGRWLRKLSRHKIWRRMLKEGCSLGQHLRCISRKTLRDAKILHKLLQPLSDLLQLLLRLRKLGFLFLDQFFRSLLDETLVPELPLKADSVLL